MILWRTNKAVEEEVAMRPELVVPWQKIIVVVLAMLGPGFLFGTIYGMTHPPEAFYLLISDRFFLFNGFFQSIVLAIFLYFLHRRGWKPPDLRVKIGVTSTLRGLELLVFTYGGFLAVAEISHLIIWLMSGTHYAWIPRLFVPTHVPVPQGGLPLSWWILIVFTIINAFYEELVYMGYGFNLWAVKYGPRAAVIFTVIARLGVHTYQGTEHLLPIAVWAVLFGLWYRYHRKVWPLILAHAMIDLISFGLLKITSGNP
jgi:membrane protease YdiL (CAAX protease family)